MYESTGVIETPIVAEQSIPMSHSFVGGEQGGPCSAEQNTGHLGTH